MKNPHNKPPTHIYNVNIVNGHHTTLFQREINKKLYKHR